jgi:DNA replication and repair protein RecF
MSLVSIYIQNIRVYENAKFIPDPNFNLIIGKNAGGKTTLLEAIHLLSTGRSYRTNKIEQLQRHNSQKLGVLGHIQIFSLPRRWQKGNHKWTCANPSFSVGPVFTITSNFP